MWTLTALVVLLARMMWDSSSFGRLRLALV